MNTTIELANAIQVLILTPETRAYLESHDPMALKQAKEALALAHADEKKTGDRIRITMEMKADDTYPADEPACAKMNASSLIRGLLMHNMEKQLRLMAEKPEGQVLTAIRDACLVKAKEEQLKINELLDSMKIELF